MPDTPLSHLIPLPSGSRVTLTPRTRSYRENFFFWLESVFGGTDPRKPTCHLLIEIMPLPAPIKFLHPPQIVPQASPKTNGQSRFYLVSKANFPLTRTRILDHDLSTNLQHSSPIVGYRGISPICGSFSGGCVAADYGVDHAGLYWQS